MDLRYRLAVVTGAGAGAGREVAVALSRRGAAVLAVDRELPAAEETATLVRQARVGAWSLQVDLAEDTDVQLLVARVRDLGGLDLLVTSDGSAGDGPWPAGSEATRSRVLELHLGVPIRLTRLVLDGRLEVRGRRDGSPAVLHVGPGDPRASPELAAAAAGIVAFTRSLQDPGLTGGTRVMAVLPGGRGIAGISRVVVDLLCRGPAGEVVELSPG